MRRFRAIASIVGAAALLVGAAPTSVSVGPNEIPSLTRAVAATEVTFSASAWGSTVTGLSGIVNSGRTASSNVACVARTTWRHTNSLGSVDIPGIAEIGAITSNTRTGNANGVETALGQSQIAGASLLGGAIEVGAIQTIARAHRQSDTYWGSAQFSIASLTVLGEEIELGTGRQVIDVPGLAQIIVRSQSVRVSDGFVSSAGTAVFVRVLETGAEIRLGEARATVDGQPATSYFEGGAHGTSVRVGGVVQSGPTAVINFPCIGTGGEARTNQVASASLGAVGSAHGITSQVSTEQVPAPRAMASNEISSVTLLGGLAELSGITTSVEVWRNEDGSLGYEPHVEIGSIIVGGISIDVPTVPGAEVTLPLVGSLHFMNVQEIRNGHGVEVVGVRLNLLGGEVVELGRAAAVLRIPG